MRKEVILGMTLGGTLLAIVVIYLTVYSNNKRDNHPVDTGGQVAEAGGAGETPGQPGESGSATTTDYKPIDSPYGPGKVGERKAAPREIVKHQLLVATVTEKTDPIWGDRLYGADTTVSVTPEPNSGSTPPPDSNPPQSGGDQSSSADSGNTGGPKGVTVLQDRVETKILPTKVRTHKVTKGETFSTIAATAYGSPNLYAYILRANPKLDPTKLKPGMEINLPDISEVKGPEKAADKNAEKTTTAGTIAHKIEAPIDSRSEYRVQPGDNLNKISIKLYGKIDMVQKIYDLNKSAIGDNPAKLKLGQVLKLPQAPATN